MFQSSGLFGQGLQSNQQGLNGLLFGQQNLQHTKIREKLETINSLTSQSQLHKVCELENYTLKGFYSNCLLIKEREYPCNMNGVGLCLYNIETKEQIKLNIGHLYAQNIMIWNKKYIYFILQENKGYVFLKSRIRFLSAQKLFVKDIFQGDEQDQIFHNIDKNFVLIRVTQKCASLIYKKKLKIIRKIKKNIKNVGSKDDSIVILVKNQIELLKLSSFQVITFQQKLRQVCKIFFDYQSNLLIRRGQGTEKDTIINMSQKTNRPISFGYDCNNFAISVIENKVLKIDRFGQIDQFNLQNANKRSEEYLRLYSDENFQIITYECDKQYTQIYQLKL